MTTARVRLPSYAHPSVMSSRIVPPAIMGVERSLPNTSCLPGHHRVCPSNHLRASLSSPLSVGLLKGNHPCCFPRPASNPLCLSASCCSCTARPHLAGHPSSIYLSSSQKMRLILISI